MPRALFVLLVFILRYLLPLVFRTDAGLRACSRACPRRGGRGGRRRRRSLLELSRRLLHRLDLLAPQLRRFRFRRNVALDLGVTVLRRRVVACALLRLRPRLFSVLLLLRRLQLPGKPVDGPPQPCGDARKDDEMDAIGRDEEEEEHGLETGEGDVGRD